ncbi:MAG TPA: hypothetical protein VG898_02435 [Solirubrobacterales bacterium]|nr:hypothetical protein [Solirubrobacterales bacterium]
MLRRATQTTPGRVALLVSAVAALLLGSAAVDHFLLGQYGDFGEAVWSAVLHVLDPSSLHEDEDAAERAVGLFQVVTGLVLLVGLLFTFIAEAVAGSLEQLGRADRPVTCRDHLLVVGGIDVASIAASAAAEAQLETELRRLVVLAPESARDARAQVLDDLHEAGGRNLKVDLVFGDTAGDSGFELAGAERARAILLMPSSSGPTPAEAADVEVTQSGLALLDYLRERDASPLVRLLFRRGRNVDASWELFPPDWDAIVADRTISALLRLAITRPPALEKVPGWVAEHGSAAPFTRLVDGAWKAAEKANGPLRLTIVGCGINAPALMEDLAQVGADTFAVTMIAPRPAFDRYLGTAEPSGVRLHYVESVPTDGEHLPRSLIESRPQMVIVTPSPTDWNQRASDASATLSILRVLSTAGGRELPVLAELFLSESAKRLPGDPRLLALSTTRSVAIAVALSLFVPERAAELERQLAAGAADH